MMMIVLDNRTLQFVIPHSFPIRTSESSKRAVAVRRFVSNTTFVEVMRSEEI